MQKIKRIAVALLAAVIISTNVYGNVLTVNAAATTGAVVAGDALIDLIIAFLASIGVAYAGDSLSDYQEDFRDSFIDFAIRHAPEVIAYAGQLADAGYINADDLDACGDDLEAVLNLPATSIVVNPTLLSFLNSDDLIAKDGKLVSDVIDEAVAQDVFYQYSVLPSNVYVGYNSSIVPADVLSADGYDSAAAHIQVDSVNGYYDIQESGTYVYSSYPSTRTDGYYDCLTYKYLYAPSLGSNAYQLLGGTVSFPSYQVYYPYGAIEYFRVNSFVYSYSFSTVSVAAGNDTTFHKAADSDCIYWAPSATMPICFKASDGTIYRLTSEGLANGLAPDALSLNPSAINTSDGRLKNASPILGGAGFGAFLALLLNSIRSVDLENEDSLVGGGSVSGTKDLSLSKEAIGSLSDVINEYYSTTTKNYYEDTTYIDGDTYVENVTNIYQQAAVDNPAITFPAVDDAGIIASVKAIPGQIADTLKELFIPDLAACEGYFLDIKSKFEWKDRFFDYGKTVITTLFDSDPEVPKLIIDFGLVESKYNYGGKAYALDMTWYARYKPQVDDIIVSLSWLCFVYWLVRNLPEIISGNSLSGRDYSSIKNLNDIHVSKTKDGPVINFDINSSVKKSTSRKSRKK